MKNTIKHTTFILLQIILTLSISQTSLFGQATSLPLLQIGDLEYQGAFAIPRTQSDQLSANYSTGTIAYNSTNGSLFLSGFKNNGIIAEYSIPALVNTTTNATALNQATLLQDFRPILNAASNGNSQNINRITGMALVNGKLIVNAEDYYDAAADNTHTTLVVENPSNIANSTVNGYYSLEGAAHAGGWISSIPNEWQGLLGGSHITGHSSRYSINSRYPMGITAFAFNPSNISGASGTIPTTTLLDFSLNNPLYAGYNSYQNANYNLISINGDNTFSGHTAADANVVVGSNNLWTEESQASYGFIVPGTRTYLTIGSSAGHNSGIGYKPSQDNDPQRNACGGPCSYDSEDYYNYYWLWDVNDLLAVKNGANPYDVKPYAYGVFEDLFRTNVNPFPENLQVISGGTFDANNGILYLSVYDGASIGIYDKLPAIVAYQIGDGGSNCTVGATCNDGNSCTTGETYDASCNCTGGTSQDTDQDGVCAANDPNDNDPCIPNACNEDDCELLANSGFDNGIAPWTSWGSNASVVNGIVNITNIQTTPNSWEVGFSQNNQNILLEQGESYTFKFAASADANRSMSLYIGMEGAPYTAYHSETFALTSTMQEFSTTFTMSSATDSNIRFDFNFGGNTTNAYIDYADLRNADCAPFCPQQGQSCDDGNSCTTGETYDASCNCTGGTSQDADQDGVCAANDPNDNDPCVPNACNGNDCELLTNTNFDNNLNNWVEWGCTTASVNGVANITGIIPSVNPWEVGFIQSNITIEQGESYDIQFSARADANRTLLVLVEQNGAPYTRYYEQTVNLTPTMQNYTFNFTMTDPIDYAANFIFYLGGNETSTYIDNASLVKTNCDTPPPSGQCDCPTAAKPGNTVFVENVSQLENAISQANSQGGNMTIKVEPGVYQLNSSFIISQNMPNLTIMGTTGNRDDVVLKGLGWNNSAVTHIFDVSADGFTIANMTISDVYYHLVQIHSENDADDFTALNVRFLDGKEQLLKVSAGASTFSDNGRVLCCAFEFTAGIAYQNYTGGIDAHKSKNWLVQNSTFKGIRSPDGVIAEHAIHFWRDCEGTTVIGNQIERCDRGIGFGLGNACENGHRGGLIMNNFVHTNRDVGIGLEYAPDIKVYNNTVITDNYPRSIEYRFSGTSNVQIINNLVSGEISDRSSGASGTLTTNYQVSDLNIFADAANYDYHLANTPSGIVDSGTALSEVTTDIDCDNRNGGIDIGADELGSTAQLNSCLPVQILSGTIDINDTYQAAQAISSDATIDADVMYKAGNLIELKNDFSTNPTNNFSIEIEDCDGN